ncbi:MAG: serine/threonine protein kinase [Myxococcaceae bacterium]|nr:serine/threonine protein kinase [Myxococcaceae bacterium]
MSLVGRHIGRYRILEQLGQGGMSVVYKGLDTALDREVAVKVLHPHLAGKEESRKRLAREAKAVARLHHPNILEVFDFAAAEASDAYIVTEYIRGKTLRQWLADESLAPPEIAAMAVHEIASALAHAHELGVIHRDLKPENVMLREDGVLKLMDFGIAKILDRDEKMTMTGALVGSPAHMAPEIVEGEEAGAEADVFSLGTMLYLFSTGRLPFTASNTTATLRKILEGVYDDPRQIVATVSDELAEIIATCLMRQPKDRYANATKLRDVLADYLREVGLERVHEELPRFFSDPKLYRKELTPRLTAALLARSERLIAEKRPARALASLNLVLAHDPSNQRTLQLLAKLKAHSARKKRVASSVRVAVAAGTVFIVGTSVWKGFELAGRAADYQEPLVRHPADVPVLTAGLFPSPPQKVVEPPPPPLPVEPLKPPDRPVLPQRPIVRANPQLQVLPVDPSPPAVAEAIVNIRPWGYLAVDKKERSVDANQVHRLKLAPGRHSLTVTCELCDEKTIDVLVEAGKPNTFNVPAMLKPAMVSISGYPEDATVRIGSETRLVREQKDNAFRIKTPPEGSTAMRHMVTYEVTLNGERLGGGTVVVKPGDAVVIGKDAR